MQTVKWGVIGLGWFGEWHADVISSLPGAELYALCTRTESRLAELAGKFSVEHTYTNYHDLLADPEVDAVSVVTMWDQHTEPTLAALAAGKHVFLEKPMASTVADCEAIVRAAHASDKFFMVGHICRFNPRYAVAKEEIATGKIGKIVSMYARRNIPAAIGAAVLPKIGPIIGDGVHDTDLMLWFSGAKVTSAYAQTVDVRHLKYPDLGWTMYRFDSGAIGVLEDVWFLPEGTPYAIDERMEIIGTEGSIQIQETGPNLAVQDSGGWHYPDTTYWPMLRGARRGALRDELDYFAQCIFNEQPPTIITPEESLEAARACLAAEESAATGRVVELDY
jgi:UDP-N-acetylglucosamine 3-dehydrogenase